MRNDALLLENYLGLIDQLPEDDKLEIIIRLSKTLKAKRKKVKSTGSLFGALDDKESAEEWIERIRSARTFNRNIESL
jgi:ribosomal protein L19E